jgi:hypothetical protein
MLTEVDAGVALGWYAKKGTIYFQHGGSNPPGHRCLVVGYAELAWHEAKLPEEHGTKEENQRCIPKDCGICVMTSSSLGSVVDLKLFQAIPWLKCWPSVLNCPTASVLDPTAPLLDRASTVDVEAQHRCGD